MKYHIPESMSNTIIELILNTTSIDEGEEKQYWFDIWNNMSVDQQKRLQDILQIEKDKLEALDIRYQEAIKNLNTEFNCKQDVVDFINS